MNSKQRICEVCGDTKQIGRNFCAFSCESCKAFFRRTALKTTVLHCASNGRCDITVQTRRLCQKCRLKKCFDIGMKTDFIRSITENEIRRQLYRDKRQKKLMSEMTKLGLNFSDLLSESDSNLSKSDSMATDVSGSDTDIDKWLDTVTSDEELVIKDQMWALNDCLNKWETNIVNKIKQKSLKLAVVPVVRPIVDYQGISQLETNKLNELSLASEVFYIQLPDSRVTIEDNEELMRVTTTRYEWLIQNVITFSKRLEGFSKICQADQMNLVKYGFQEVLFTRILTYYDYNRQEFNLWLDNDRTLTISLNKFTDRNPGSYNLLTNFSQFINKVFPQMNKDPVIMDLLSAIVLLNPNRPNLTHRKSIKLEQQMYIYLLQRYLQLKYPSDIDWQTNLQQLMDSLSDLIITAQMHKSYELKELQEYRHYIQYYGPLYREVYDLETIN